jgi:hypothetical protein
MVGRRGGPKRRFGPVIVVNRARTALPKYGFRSSHNYYHQTRNGPAARPAIGVSNDYRHETPKGVRSERCVRH